jgi:hypothetical protein
MFVFLSFKSIINPGIFYELNLQTSPGFVYQVFFLRILPISIGNNVMMTESNWIFSLMNFEVNNAKHVTIVIKPPNKYFSPSDSYRIKIFPLLLRLLV